MVKNLYKKYKILLHIKKAIVFTSTKYLKYLIHVMIKIIRSKYCSERKSDIQQCILL